MRSTSAASSSSPGEIRIRVRNPQPEELTIASVTVDDAIVPFTLDGPATLKRLRSSTIVVAATTGSRRPDLGRRHELDRDRDREGDTRGGRDADGPARGFLGYGLIGLLVGVVPVALGLLWLPSLRRADPNWLAAFMAMTAGLLSFLGVESLAEAFTLQALLPGGLGGAGLVLLGVALSALGMTFLSSRLSRGRAGHGRALAGASRRDRDRDPQPRRGPRDRHVVRVRRAPARDVPDRRLHDPQRHRGARDRGAGRGGAPRLVRCSSPRSR